MQKIKPALLVGTVGLFLIGAAPPAPSFVCGSGPGAQCGCEGTSDCTDMRHSNLCAGSLSCEAGEGGIPICTCTAARVKDPVVGGDTTTKPKMPANAAPPPTSAKAPP